MDREQFLEEKARSNSQAEPPEGSWRWEDRGGASSCTASVSQGSVALSVSGTEVGHQLSALFC